MLYKQKAYKAAKLNYITNFTKMLKIGYLI